MSNTFRPVYRKLDDTEQMQCDAIKDAAIVLEAAIKETKTSREQALALTNLEQSVMWAIKGVMK